jgi:NAD-dependent deacetylase
LKSLVEKLSGFGLRADMQVAVLTGAGVSAESGVPTFRGEDGLWRTYRAEQLATPEAFERDPRTVWEWYDYRRQIVASKQPNPAHAAIARLDEALAEFLLITQNVDGLHERAGTKRIIELHGNLFRVRCTAGCGVSENLEVRLNKIPPKCGHCGALLRPDVVWFGEALPEHAISTAFQVSQACSLMLVVGTSAVVQPAASMPLIAKQAGARVIEINPDPTPLTPFADIALSGNAGEVMPRVADALLDLMAS